jgi:hypothetical protein
MTRTKSAHEHERPVVRGNGRGEAEMLRKLVLVAVACATSVVMFAGPASALTKVRYQAELSDHVAFTGFCDFTVYSTDTGTAPMITETYDEEGNLVRVDVTPQGWVQTTLEGNGNSVTVNNTGPVTILFEADGTLTVYQRGPSLTGDQGLITGVAFLTHTYGRVVTTGVPNASTGLTDFTSVVWIGNVTDLCAALAA